MINHLSIRKKFILLGIFGFISLGMIIFLAINISKVGLDSIDDIFHDSKEVQNIQHELIAPIFYLRELTLSLVIAPNNELKNEINEEINPIIKTLNQKFLINSNLIQKEWVSYRNSIYKTQQFIKRGFEEGAYINVNEDERKYFYILIQTLQELQSKELLKSKKTFENAKKNILDNQVIIFSVSFLLVFISLFWGVYVIKKIVHSIEQLKIGHNKFFNFLKNKNTKDNIGIKLDTNDELGDMAKTINKEMIEAKKGLRQDLILIKSATKMLSQLKKGNLDERLHVDAKSKELNILKQVINQMVDDLEYKIQHEIEQRTNQEKLLIQQSKLASMGEMIGNIAHQWRQPLSELNAILMNIETKYLFNDFSEEFIQSSVNECNEITLHMSNTINDFQNFFKPSKTKEYFSVLDACKKASAIVQSSLKHHNIKYSLICDKCQDIFGYPNEFSQAFLNILSNAKDALVQNKIINPFIKVCIKKGEQYTVITIEDNAGGIKEKYFDRIFEPYFTTKHAKKGTGIGLYMSKTIIEQNMTGYLNVHNKKNGAKFTIKIK